MGPPGVSWRGLWLLAGTDASRSVDLGVRGMAFRGVAVFEIGEVRRAWLSGWVLRQVAAQAGVDRKTARRYVEAAVEAGLAPDGGGGWLNGEPGGPGVGGDPARPA